MSDYVKVEKILEFLDAETNAINSTFGEIGGEAGAYVECFKNVRSYIERFPTAGAVPVVRCKDCEFYRRTEEIHPGFGTCDFVEMVRQDNDFCSKGEKRVNMASICKWCEGEVCTNADCPIAADYCPVPDTPDVCKHESRYNMENRP